MGAAMAPSQRSHPMRRWAPPVLAAVLTAALAGTVGTVADQVATSRTAAAPELRTIPAAALARLGVRLAPVPLAPYCSLAERAAWLVQPGWVSCAIGRPAAERSARRGGGARVLEAVLARVTAVRPSGVGHNRLTWLVVLQGMGPRPGPTCQPHLSVWTACRASPQPGWGLLVFVDGVTGSALGTLSLGPVGAARPAPGRATLP